jgi:hypothetical protein
MVSIYGTFIAFVITGAISSMLWIELAGSESLLARTKPIKRTAWRLASLYKPFDCTALKLGSKTSNKLRIGSARPKSVAGAGSRTASCRFHAGSRRHLTPLQSLKYQRDRLDNGQPMRHVWQPTDTFSRQSGMLGARVTTSQNHLIEKDGASLGTVRTACRVWDIYVIAYTTCSFTSKFESQRTHFDVILTCWVWRITHTKKRNTTFGFRAAIKVPVWLEVAQSLARFKVFGYTGPLQARASEIWKKRTRGCNEKLEIYWVKKIH